MIYETFVYLWIILQLVAVARCGAVLELAEWR